ncbi:MAG: hypothetical protein M3296_06425 [Actinomycetota bacterium]|nr:hypothetical protein [Actinomycetota bacterium]
MSVRDVARVLALARVGLGGGLLLAPRLTTAVWVGADARRSSVQVVGRALGAREVVLGGIALHTVDHPQVGPRWQRTLAAVDAVDLLATLLARRRLPSVGVILISAMAATGAGGQAWTSAKLSAAAQEGASGPA